MATDEVRYLSYLDALFIHFELMRLMVEPRRGVFDRSLVEAETLKLVLAVEADQWKVDEIENWLRQHTTRIGA